MPKIYVDTNLISRLSDPQRGGGYRISGDVAEAILVICGSGAELVTSKQMLDEVLRTKMVEQRALLALVATLAAKVPYNELSYGVPGYLGGAYLGAATFGGGSSQEPSLTELATIFDADDAVHVFQAVKSSCDMFLTLDERTILRRAASNPESVARLCPGLIFADPQQLTLQLRPQSG